MLVGSYLANLGENIGKVEGSRGQVSCGQGCGDALIKGEVLGG
jgi:hypothetical protein